ncbi:hypothetical protein PR048_004841 [Dryococelus australis]|uniref:Uncharacterized protein n=1 Tax=Dryococelus australis TaxID=614101 RepID=A0ABQ9I6I5_9NEOP|nr:hypothetical protein PR048_004841 [Dryococelus australis]
MSCEKDSPRACRPTTAPRARVLMFIRAIDELRIAELAVCNVWLVLTDMPYFATPASVSDWRSSSHAKQNRLNTCLISPYHEWIVLFAVKHCTAHLVSPHDEYRFSMTK